MSEREPLTDAQREAALKDIRGPDEEKIVPAAKLLSDDRVPATTARLVALLDEGTNADSRQGILYALSWHAELGTWDLFIRILSDPSEHEKVRGQAAEGLAYSFYKVPRDSAEFERGVAAVLAALEDPSLEVRYNAIFAAGATRHPPMVSVLKKLLNDTTPVPDWGDTIGQKAADALDRILWRHRWRKPSR